MKFATKYKDGEYILSTFPNECALCLGQINKEYDSIECPQTRCKCRRAMFNLRDRVVIACSQHYKTTKNFKDAVQVYISMIPFLEKTAQELKQVVEQTERGYTKSLLHNLVNQNAHMIQLLDQFLPQNERFAEVSTTIANTRSKIEADSGQVALSLFKLKKIASSMKAEFSAYDRFRKENIAVNPKVYKLYDVVKIVVHIFFADLHEHNIYVKIGQCYEKGYFDFEVMRVALYYIFENAAKYAKSNSQILVDFGQEGDKHCINISMESLYIEPNEVAKIFDKGFSGSNAKKAQKAGSGLGMYHAKELMKLSDGDIAFIAGGKVTNRYNGKKYSYNKIKILVSQVPQAIKLYGR